jgi:alpha-L-rhamnosidase
VSELADATVGLRAEHLSRPLGIGVATPRLSWRTQTARPGWYQQAYEVRSGGEVVRVESDDSVLVPWPFAPLRSRERRLVEVRALGRYGGWTEWSDPCEVEAGLLNVQDWRAAFVAPTSKERASPHLRYEFTCDRPVRQARLYATALGVYDAHLNGAAVGDQVLAPGWTSYDHRLRYQTYDITASIRQGTNVIGAMLGDGWFRGRLGWRGSSEVYGDRIAFLAQLEIEHDDETVTIVATDEGWRAASGPILASSLYDGERYDARCELDGWSEPGFDDSNWEGVERVERDLSTLVAPTGPPIRRTETVAPVEILVSPSGRAIVDFGQNLVGWLRIRVEGDAGREVTIRHAEVLEGGELCVRPLRSADATDRYILRGSGVEVWEPRFTFHGFRYAEIDGWPGELEPQDVEAVVVHSDLERTGWFSCSDPLVERLHENAVWSMRGNFVDVPTDCPQRDERLGWTGDIQVFAPTACFLYDSAGFLRSWLADLALEQGERGGRVPNVVPDVLPPVPTGAQYDWNAAAAGWGDAAVVVPWVVYQRSGDTEALAAQFPSMCGWVDHVGRLADLNGVWDLGFQFGDWLDPAAPADAANRGLTDPGLVATAYFARSVQLVAEAAAVLGHLSLNARYCRLAERVRAAFRSTYLTSNGLPTSDSQTACAIALEFDLVGDGAQRELVGRRLAELVAANDFRVGTGFLGTPLVCDALCNVGEAETAYRLLLERGCPSWLYPVTMGATTIWERWDSMLPDGRVNLGEMTSFNHYAFGAVADWLHRSVAGLTPTAPGYRRFTVQPVLGTGLTHAQARHDTPYGTAEIAWRIIDRDLEVSVAVPPNTTAEVWLPARGPLEVGSGSHRWLCPMPERRDIADSVRSTTPAAR